MEYIEQQGNPFFSKLGRMYSFIGMSFILCGVILLLIPALPYLYYNINPDATEDEVVTLGEPIAQITPTPSATPSLTPTPVVSVLPPQDPNLPTTNTLIIPGIGVNGPIHEGTNSKSALYKGIWRTPDWGTPEDFTKPTILAAHRFGYIEWSAQFRKTNSFANLPKLKVGDTFTVIWNQRKFDYVVRRIEEANLITTLHTDMILYTCKYLKSPIRIIIYADRVQ